MFWSKKRVYLHFNHGRSVRISRHCVDWRENLRTNERTFKRCFEFAICSPINVSQVLPFSIDRTHRSLSLEHRSRIVLCSNFPNDCGALCIRKVFYRHTYAGLVLILVGVNVYLKPPKPKFHTLVFTIESGQKLYGYAVRMAHIMNRSSLALFKQIFGAQIYTSQYAHYVNELNLKLVCHALLM